MVLYKNIWLAKNSQAYELYHSNDPDKFKKLDKLIKETAQKMQELMKRY